MDTRADIGTERKTEHRQSARWPRRFPGGREMAEMVRQRRALFLAWSAYVTAANPSDADIAHECQGTAEAMRRMDAAGSAPLRFSGPGAAEMAEVVRFRRAMLAAWAGFVRAARPTAVDVALESQGTANALRQFAVLAKEGRPLAG